MFADAFEEWAVARKAAARQRDEAACKAAARQPHPLNGWDALAKWEDDGGRC